MSELKVVPIYAGVLGIILIALSVRVIRLRRAEQVAIGGGGRARSHPFSIALGRFVTTEEIAGAVDCLWSPDGTSITGAEVRERPKERSSSGILRAIRMRAG